MRETKLGLNKYFNEIKALLADKTEPNSSVFLSNTYNQLLSKNSNLHTLSYEELVRQFGSPLQHISDPIEAPKERSSIFKKIFILFFSLFVIFILSLAALVYSFTPFLKVDDVNNRITILGGLIDINGSSGRFKVGNQVTFANKSYQDLFDGEVDVLQNPIQDVNISIRSGLLNIASTNENIISWSCQTPPAKTSDVIEIKKKNLFLNFHQLPIVNCSLEVPRDINIFISGDEAKVQLFDISSNTQVKLKSGDIIIEPMASTRYQYHFHVNNGSSPTVQSSINPQYNVDIQLTNGQIRFK